MRHRLLFAVVLLPVVQAAQAVPIEAGLFTQNSFRTCGSPDECFNNDTLIDFVNDIDLSASGVVTTRQVDPLDPFTQAASSAGYTGPGFTPAVSSYAFSGAQTRFTVVSFGLQRYEFLDDGEINIGGALTYSQSGSTDSSAQNPNGRTDAGLVAFRMAGDVLESDNCNLLFGGLSAVNSTGSLLSCILRDGDPFPFVGTIELQGLLEVQSAFFDIPSTPVDFGLANRELTVTGSQGDVFFLGAFLSSFAHLGGFADSRNTLRLDIDDPSLVRASFRQETFVTAPFPVSEPSSLTLLGAGILLLALAWGRRQPQRPRGGR